jgi:light-regulated signal transduction histidine kinase (bacteriophytochrome)
MTAEPARAQHEIKINLPETLYALVDGDRMDKVIENLIINGLEAMGDRRGTLTISAGATETGKPFFSVSDTGEGINERFIADRLVQRRQSFDRNLRWATKVKLKKPEQKKLCWSSMTTSQCGVDFTGRLTPTIACSNPLRVKKL